MLRLRVVLLIACGLMVGCGGNPALPTVDAAAEKDDEELIKKAGAAERKARPTGKKPVHNPDDE